MNDGTTEKDCPTRLFSWSPATLTAKLIFHEAQNGHLVESTRKYKQVVLKIPFFQLKCAGNLLRKHRERGRSRDGKLQSRECCSFNRKEGTGNLPLRSKRPLPTGAAQPHLATSGGLRRESWCSRARTHISYAPHPSLSAGWEDAKLTIFHLTVVLAEEKSSRGCCGCWRRRQRPGRLCAGGTRGGAERWGIRPPPRPPPLFHGDQWGGRLQRSADGGGATGIRVRCGRRLLVGRNFAGSFPNSLCYHSVFVSPPC